jgi:hypothetical protein
MLANCLEEEGGEVGVGVVVVVGLEGLSPLRKEASPEAPECWRRTFAPMPRNTCASRKRSIASDHHHIRSIFASGGSEMSTS